MEHIDADMQDILPKDGREFDLPQLVLATMRYTEQKSGELPGSAKLNVFKDCIGGVLETAHMHNLVDNKQYGILKSVIDTGFGMVLSLVDAFIAISKHPEWIQIEKEVRACCIRTCKRK